MRTLPSDWSVRMEPTTETHYMPILRLMAGNTVWEALTRPQRELLLSCHADAPIKARADVTARLVKRGLINADLTVTEAGKEIIQWHL